jgi:DNA polymerase-3 subunit delta
MVDAAFAGKPAALESELAKARSAGTSPGAILFAAQRQVAQLHKWRSAIEDGAPMSVDALMPPVHFSRKRSVEAALKAWTGARLLRAMSQLADATLESRRQAALADTIVQRALLSIAVNARRREA